MRVWNVQTGAAEPIDEAQFGAAIQQTDPDGRPLYLPVRDDRYPIRTADGQLFTVTGNDLLAELKQGSALATWNEADLEARKREEGGIGGALSAAGRGLASGLTLGLAAESDPDRLLAEAETARQRGDVNEWSRLRSAAAAMTEHPIVRTGAELGGMVLPSLVPGVGQAGAAARGGLLARTLGLARFTPTGAVAQGTAALGAAVGERLAASAGERALAGALARGATAEGAEAAAALAAAAARASLPVRAATGAVQAGAETAAWMTAVTARDPDADAEAVMASGLMGVAVGGGIGAAFPVLGAGLRAGRSLFSKSTPEGVQAVAESAFGKERTPGFFGRVFRAVQRGVSPIDEEAQRVLMDSGPAGEAARALTRNPEAKLAEEARDLVSRVDDVVRAETEVRYGLGDVGGLNPAVLARAVDEKLATVAIGETRAAARVVDSAIEGMERDFANRELAALNFFDMLAANATDIKRSVGPLVQRRGKARLYRQMVEEMTPAERVALQEDQFVAGEVLGREGFEEATYQGEQATWRGVSRARVLERKVRDETLRTLDELLRPYAGWDLTAEKKLAAASSEPEVNLAVKRARRLYGEIGRILKVSVTDWREANDVAAIAARLDEARKKLAKFVAKYKEPLDAFRGGELEKVVAPIRGLHQRVRVALHDKRTFGRASDINRRVNPLWSDLLELSPTVNKMLRQGKRYGGWFHEFEADPQRAVAAFDTILDEVGGDRLRAKLELHAARAAGFADEVGRLYPGQRRVQEVVKGIAERTSQMRSVLDAAALERRLEPSVSAVLNGLARRTRINAQIASRKKLASGRLALEEVSKVRDGLDAARTRLAGLVKTGEAGGSMAEARELHARLTAQIGAIDELLSRRAVWGEAATLRARLGGPSGPHVEHVQGMLLTRPYREAGTLREVRSADPMMISPMVRGLDKPEYDALYGHLGQYVQDAERYAADALKTGVLTGEAAAAARRLQGSASALGGSLKAKRDMLRVIAMYQSLQRAEAASVPFMGIALGAGIGGLAGGDTGSASIGGLAGGLLARPATMVRMLGALDSVKAKLAAPYAAAARSTRAGAGAAAKAVRAATPKAAGRWGAPEVGDTEQDTRTRATVATHAALGEQGAVLAPVAGAVASRAQAALAEVRPPDGTRDTAAWAQYEDRRQAVVNPSRGSVAARSWALARVYPATKKQLAAAALIASAEVGGRVPDARKATEVYLTTGVVLDPHLAPARIARVQKLAATTAAALEQASRGGGGLPTGASKRGNALRAPTEIREP